MDKLKIALLCNNKMAMPLMARLAADSLLCGIATADNNSEIASLYAGKAREARLHYTSVGAGNYVAALTEWIHVTGADVVIVFTFPWRLPASLLAVPRLGFLNVHPGLLPEMRGADPIFETIRQRMPVAGTTVHIMDAGLDTGPIVLRVEIPTNPEMTYGMLAAQLAYLAEKMCMQVAGTLQQGLPLLSTPQDESVARYWPKVGIEAFTIIWDTMDSGTIKALVKSCNPVAKGIPVTINGWRLGICEVAEINLQGDTSNIVPGTIVVLDQQNGLIVFCKDGKGLRLEVVVAEEGYFPGYKLAFFGIQAGMIIV